MNSWTYTYFYEVEDAGESDPATAEIEVTKEEMEAIQAATEDGKRLRDVQALQKLHMRAYKQVMENLIQELKEIGDDFTLQCLKANANPFDYAYTLHVDVFDPIDEDNE